MTRTRKRKQRGSGFFNAVTDIFKKKKPVPYAQTGFPSPGGALIPANQWRPMENFAVATSPENYVLVEPSQTNSTPVARSIRVPPVAPSVVPSDVPPIPAPAAPIDPAIEQRNRIVREFVDILDIVGFNESNTNILIESILNSLSFDETTQNSRVDTFPITDFIPDYELSNFNKKVGSVIGAGGFGTIYNHKTNPDRIIKSLRYDNTTPEQLRAAGLPEERGSMQNFMKNILRETFIQFYLSKLQPQLIPAVYGIAKAEASGNNAMFFIEMERIKAPYMDLDKYIDEKGQAFEFREFAQIIRNVCNALILLEQDVNFVHRDFKLNNIMINPETSEIKILDFGYASINIPGYSIINFFPAFLPTADRRFQQDMGMFFVFFEQFFINEYVVVDPYISNFIISIIPSSLRFRTSFRNVYNINGSVFANANTEILTPQNVLVELDNFETITGFRGGRRRRRNRKTKKLTKRRA